MPYNSLTSRTDVQALVPEDVAADIIEGSVEQSAALSLMRRVTMARNQQRMPVLSALPLAYFVAGDTGLKQTTEMAWSNKYLIAEEIAAIVPVPEAVLDDAGFDIFGEVRPRLVEAIGRVIDNAIFFGVNAPVSWPTNITAAAVAAGNAYARGTSTVAQGGIAEDINQVMGLAEADGYDVNGFATRRSYKAKLRGARDSTGQQLLDVNGGTASVYGEPLQYTMAGLWPGGASAAELLAGDWTQFILAIRQDLSWKISTEAVIQDNTGAIQYNLFQQDMVALRVTIRLAWQVANPINYEQATEANRYPIAVLRSP